MRPTPFDVSVGADVLPTLQLDFVTDKVSSGLKISLEVRRFTGPEGLRVGSCHHFIVDDLPLVLSPSSFGDHALATDSLLSDLASLIRTMEEGHRFLCTFCA